MENSPNWVERRAIREKVLQDNEDGVWQDVRAAFQTASDSYNEHYSQGGQGSPFRVDHKQEDDTRLRITLPIATDRGNRITILVAFEKDKHQIIVTRDGKPLGLFHISSDEKHSFIQNGKTADDIAQQILEPLLFGDHQPAQQSPQQPYGRSTGQEWMR